MDSVLTGILLFIVTFWYRNKMETIRIRALAEYLEQANTGRAAILSASGEDEFSKLEDEVYKTVTFLYQTNCLHGPVQIHSHQHFPLLRYINRSAKRQ